MPGWDGKPLALDVGNTLRKAASSAIFTVNRRGGETGKDRYSPPMAVMVCCCLRAQRLTMRPFSWHNATVYFVLTDRFVNGDPSNDNSYGRHKDGMQEIGTFHGGDLQGLTSKLDYLQQLGVNALWISSALSKSTAGSEAAPTVISLIMLTTVTTHRTGAKLDANMGSEDDLRALVHGAHQRGIRILFDVVMNHTGYATLADMQQYQFGACIWKAMR
ncbi:alpha-amylase family glycosyl hydrolase [Shigella flexneri]